MLDSSRLNTMPSCLNPCSIFRVKRVYTNRPDWHLDLSMGKRLALSSFINNYY
jgi:hypothetical protein